VQKIRNWFGGIWVSTCLHFVQGFRVEKMRKLDFLSSMVLGARKEEVGEKIKKKKERKDK
jgi:hypothetical protein